MSFAGDTTGGMDSGTGPKPFFCYKCSRTVIISASAAADDPFCPLCNEGFLEEYENPNPNSSPNTHQYFESFFSDSQSSVPFLFSSSSAGRPFGGIIDPQNPRSLSSLVESAYAERTSFDPVAFLHNHLQDLRSGGARIQFVIENHPMESGFGLPSNIGNYFLGPGLEQLIQQLVDNDPNRYGTPPASKSAIDALPAIKITDELLNSDMNQCAVCKDEFQKGAEVKQMPCKHIYHNDCILPWLEMHNSCPVCRFELPTDDPDYENRARGAQGRAGSGSGGEGRGATNRTLERRFSISLPWPFRGFGSGSGPSYDGGGGGSAGGGSGMQN